ncbi:DUF1887 family protein [candidate division KSB1 bacterium]|nr:DUF1887 family protein [candidate division KSB1 bacterium]
MSTILVSLVSDQTLPNIFFIRELDNVDFYLLLTTPQMEEKNKSDSIIAASGKEKKLFTIITVKETSMTEISAALDMLDFKDSDQFIVNLTGGTKIMSIAVYNYFRNKSSEIYYLPIGKNEYHKIFPEVKKKEHDLKYRISVQDYMTACNVDILNPNDLNQLVRPVVYTKKFFDFFCTATTLDLRDISTIRDIMNKKKKKLKKHPLPIEEYEWLGPFLERASFVPLAKGVLSLSEIRYLCGEWFEEFVYNLIKKEHSLDDCFIAKGIQIRRKDVQNELDVVFTLQNNLHTIECKTGLYDSSAQRNILDETIYKAQALRREFTLFVRSHIFTTVKHGSARTMIREHSERRSKLFGINLVEGGVLQDAVERRNAVLAIK